MHHVVVSEANKAEISEEIAKEDKNVCTAPL